MERHKSLAVKLLPFAVAKTIEAGLDEAGRGCLAGPVVAAACIIKPGTRLPGLDDSKKLNAKSREHLAPLIKEKSVAWAIGVVGPQEIDEINILQASFLAMHRALDQLAIAPELLLVDGNRFVPYKGIPHQCEVKGDGRFRSIAAASILAKTHRDELMERYHAEFPHYNWRVNKGYPTQQHREAIRQYGPCSLHRKSFQLLPAQLKLEL